MAKKRRKNQKKDTIGFFLCMIASIIMFTGLIGGNGSLFIFGIVVLLLARFRDFLRLFSFYKNFEDKGTKKVGAIYKGKKEELKIANILKKSLSLDYKIINNVTFIVDGDTTQIDHIIVSKYGIFVLETKNYQGIITGNDYDREWCQTIYRMKNYFMNPVHQNYKHIKFLEKITGVNEESFVNIVVFSEKAKLNVRTKNIVISEKDLIKKIKYYNVKFLTDREVEKIYNLINENNMKDLSSKFEHLKNVKNIKNNKY